MYYYVDDSFKDTVFRVSAKSKEEAVRKWFRYGTDSPKMTDREINDAFKNGDLAIEVHSEGDIVNIP